MSVLATTTTPFIPTTSILSTQLKSYLTDLKTYDHKETYTRMFSESWGRRGQQRPVTQFRRGAGFLRMFLSSPKLGVTSWLPEICSAQHLKSVFWSIVIIGQTHQTGLLSRINTVLIDLLGVSSLSLPARTGWGSPSPLPTEPPWACQRVTFV